MTPTILIAEQGLQWMAAVRTCLKGCGSLGVRPAWIHVQATAEVPHRLASAPTALVILEVSSESAAADVVHLDRWRESFPSALYLAALDRRYETAQRTDLVLALREAGAARVLFSPRRAAAVVPLWERHLTAARANAVHAHGGWSEGLSAAWKLSGAAV